MNNNSPRTYSRIKERVVTSIALDRSQVQALDVIATRDGVTRSGVVRAILAEVLGEDTSDNPDRISFPDLMHSEQGQGFINPETPVRKVRPSAA